MAEAPKLSVVVATYNRLPLLKRLLEQLARQSLPPSEFEVVVVDDGSAEPVKPALSELSLPYSLAVVTQPNAGQAAARHRGVLQAKGEFLVIIDDDMQLPEDFLAQHLSRHPPGERSVVLGQIRPDPNLGEMPLFERWHARMLDVFVEDYRNGRVSPKGNHLYTGNVSLPRADYLAVGGFDPSLRLSEDAELGLRLEKAGLTTTFSEAAYVLHGSDHTSLEKWRRRAFQYGVFDHRIAQKHPDLSHANPWRFLSMVHPLSRPLLAASALAPNASERVASVAISTAHLVDRLGLEKLAIAGTTLVYGMEYFRGIRSEIGPLGPTLGALISYLRGRLGPNASPPMLARWAQFVDEVKADHAALQHYDAKYRSEIASARSLGGDLVQKIGFQLLVAYRLMRLFRDLEMPLQAKIASRLIRHLYGSDIHWDAEFAPGVMLVHGMGLSISHEAKVGPGCILFQNVTLGMGIDPETRKTGAPAVGSNVHIGPGATLLGPITVGENSKIMAGAVVTESIPANSLVETPSPALKVRDRKGPKPGRTAPRALAPRGVPKV